MDVQNYPYVKASFDILGCSDTPVPDDLTIPQKEFSCAICPDGMTGDGQTCFGKIWIYNFLYFH